MPTNRVSTNVESNKLNEHFNTMDMSRHSEFNDSTSSLLSDRQAPQEKLEDNSTINQ